MADSKKDHYDVMISYSWGNKEEDFPCQKRMLKLKKELEETAGLKVWMDVEKMRGNKLRKMSQAVEGSDVILMCTSARYQSSKDCEKEANYADYWEKPLVHLKYDNHKASSWLGILICNEIYYDVRTDAAMMKNLPEIVKAINEKLPSTGSKGTVSSKPVSKGRVFISYQWEDQRRAKQLRDELIQDSYKVLLDIDMMDEGAGNILDCMANAVENADAVLVLISKKYKSSQSCRTA
ncbi:uncharacterized protein [Amphiura filiformis]|uniref:uncharacterized protein n=1 Tax=Amphiura filiformis TaxID=82378 RepID=UPI003B20DC3A